MSTRFTKILTYCVLTMAIIAIVVCSAMCLTNAVGVKISLETKYLSKTTATENGQEIVLKINGEETNELYVRQDSVVTLTFEAPGYTLQGWYNVSEAELADDMKPVGESFSYEFTATKDTNFTAVFDAIKYVVTYEGVKGLGTRTYTYGDEIEKVENPVVLEDGSLGVFLGWKNTSDEYVSSIDDLDSDNVVLNANIKSLSDYQFKFIADAGTYGKEDGVIYYDSKAGANLESNVIPTREFYELDKIILNGQSYLLTDKDAINLVLAQNYVNADSTKEISVPVQVEWKLVFENITINYSSGFGDNGTFEITNDGKVDIESIILSDEFASIDPDIQGIKITYKKEIKENEETKYEEITDWETKEYYEGLTVADLLAIESFEINGDEGNITIDIEFLYNPGV